MVGVNAEKTKIAGAAAFCGVVSGGL